MAGVRQTMKAAQVREFGSKLEICDVPIPEPGHDEVLIELKACGVCHTDLHVVDGDWEVKADLPRTPGHEGIGHVVSVGSSVTNVKVGERVGVPWLYNTCMACRDCLGGNENLCAKGQQQAGFSVNGCFAEFVVAKGLFVAKIPAKLSDIEAVPIMCAGVTVYRGLKETNVKPFQTVVIAGAGGGLGHVAVQYAKTMALRVIGIDGGDEKMKLLKDLGCDETIDFMQVKDVPARVLELTHGDGAEGALLVAASPRVFSQAIEYLRPGGTAVVIALPPGTFPTPIFKTVLKGLNIKGSIVGTRLDLQEALDLAARGGIRAHIETKRLSDVNDALDMLRQMKVSGRLVLDYTT
ncbi:unnamed protein product [Vitrella brassicaformis CCMP3155]|uniref:Enoyl reductase (ER) domain-containing protein n=1 Tax=Vitrella brassicaformis (strain CCMP3155) TaxID=1169540 RepID=A0A0G4G4I4_VITBC|nr:unnamed protein product [Vitrella brassicaformis CCMP3155]|mmetsp:Transcript_28931/g.72104  ORF Transcript_28931/g.72104 Transcript_28931/m.72104 type:complete len:351 (-) Transcript_28931:70-1122(-)|eukprot:CEM23304.1 unnamed protein product [Vitrella brassicaformis CCMP3155]